MRQFSRLHFFRKEKNVVNSFKVQANGTGDSYNVDNVLQSLGELETVDKKNRNNKTSKTATIVNGSGSHNNNNNGNGNPKNRRRSNEKQTGDDEDKKSTSDPEDNNNDEEEETASETFDKSTNFSSSTVEFNHIQQNVVVVDEPSADLKRQVSR